MQDCSISIAGVLGILQPCTKQSHVFQVSSVNSPHKGQWRGALIFSLIYARINGWVNTGEAGDLRRHRAHYDVIVMNNADVTMPSFVYQYTHKYLNMYIALVDVLIYVYWVCVYISYILLRYSRVESFNTHDISRKIFCMLDLVVVTGNFCVSAIDRSHRSHSAIVPYPTMHQCAHFCSEWCIVGYGTGALWDLWIWFIVW